VARAILQTRAAIGAARKHRTKDHNMSDVSTNEPVSAASNRKSVSVRSFIDYEGNEVDKIEEATGAKYELKGGKSFAMQFGTAGEAATMFAIFGMHTKVGNVANTVLNAKDEPGDANDASEAIEAFLAMVSEGKWAERAAGGGGFAKIDIDALAEAMTQVKATSSPMDAAAAGEYKAKAIEKLNDDKAFRTKLKKHPAIAPIYEKLTGTKTASVDDLLNI
jgi:hypothetical protein